MGSAMIAGCTDGGTSEDTPDVETQIDRAKEHIESARDSLDEESAQFDSVEGTVSINDSLIRSDLDQAENVLNAVKNRANEGQAKYIDYLYNYITYSRLITSGIVHTAETINYIESARSYWKSGRYDDAISAIQDGGSETQQAQSILSDIQNLETELENYESKAEGREAYDFGDKWDFVEDYLTATSEFLRGLKYWIRGDQSYENLSAEYEAENYSAAMDYASEASSHYATAENTFSDAEDKVPSDSRPDFISAACHTGYMREGVTALKEAIEAEQDRNYQRADEKASEAEEAFNSAENC